MGRSFQHCDVRTNRTLTSALDSRTPSKMVYGVKPDLADSRVFGDPCAIVEPGKKLKELDDRAKMCLFLGYKYGGGGYRVWDPRESAVVESEKGLRSPTYHDLANDVQQLDVAPDEPLSTIASSLAVPDARPRLVVSNSLVVRHAPCCRD